MWLSKFPFRSIFLIWIWFFGFLESKYFTDLAHTTNILLWRFSIEKNFNFNLLKKWQTHIWKEKTKSKGYWFLSSFFSIQRNHLNGVNIHWKVGLWFFISVLYEKKSKLPWYMVEPEEKWQIIAEFIKITNKVSVNQGSDSNLVGKVSTWGLISKASRARVKITMSLAWVIWALDEARGKAKARGKAQYIRKRICIPN